MEENFSSIVECCDSCNISYEPWNIRQYEVLYQGSKIHDQNKITLCYVCSKIAKYAEQLINNLQGYSVINPEVQFQYCQKVSIYSHSASIKARVQQITSPPINKKPIKDLSIFNLGTLQLSDADSGDTVSSYSVTSAKNGKIFTECGKIKVKIEDNFYEVGICDDANSYDEETDATIIKQEYFNEEDKAPHQDSISVDINVKEEKKRDKNISESETDNSLETDIIEESPNKEKQITVPTVHITTEQYIQEKSDRSKTDRYINSQYKCTDCVIGFFHNDDYLKHMEKHNESAGPYVCELCTQHLKTLCKLQDHMKIHLTRYKCNQCNVLRNQPSTIREHLYSVHKIGVLPKFECDKCNAVYNRKSSLRHHMKAKHRPRDKVTCTYCQKIYSSLETLKNHMILLHPEELSRVKQEKRHKCQECGAAFRTFALLKRHQLKHSDRRDFYCVECDKGFKSEAALKKHLTSTAIHLQYSELPFACTQCEKRFPTKRNLDMHTNSIHLNIKPYQCDQCSKQFFLVYKHKKNIHEDNKLPRKYQCKICDKAFARRPILEGHTRTHTGERPYQCDKCEATFTQSGTLNTHKKIVHLKIKRNRKTK